jgi:hypothetical protein
LVFLFPACAFPKDSQSLNGGSGCFTRRFDRIASNELCLGWKNRTTFNNFILPIGWQDLWFVVILSFWSGGADRYFRYQQYCLEKKCIEPIFHV